MPRPRFHSLDRSHGRRLRHHEAAAHLGFSGSTLARWRCYGGGPPFYRVHRTVFYNRDDLDMWLAQRRQQPKPVPSRETAAA
jgi:hypothetical protein